MIEQTLETDTCGLSRSFRLAAVLPKPTHIDGTVGASYC